MPTRAQERERLRQHREQAERQAASSAQRRLVAGYFVAGLAALAIVGGAIAIILNNKDAGGSPTAGPFGTHFEGLEERREAAGVPTMSEGGGSHFHPNLEVFVRGKPIFLPPNIGIDPERPLGDMAGLHTHDSSGTIHNEAGDNSTLGQFFAIWGVPFSESRLGPYRATGPQKVRMWVEGRPSRAFGDLALADGQHVIVAYGTENQARSALQASGS